MGKIPARHSHRLLIIVAAVLGGSLILVWFFTGGDDRPAALPDDEVSTTEEKEDDRPADEGEDTAPRPNRPPDVEAAWDNKTATFTLNVTAYGDQIIESINLAPPSLYILGGCDESTDYYEDLPFTGVVDVGDTYETRRYVSLEHPSDSEDGEENLMPATCFAINYRNGPGQPLAQLIEVRDRAPSAEGFELTEAEAAQLRRDFGQLVSDLNLTPLGERLMFGEYGFRIKHHVPEDPNDLSLFWVDGFYNIEERTFYTRVKDIDQELLAHEFMHHVWHDYLPMEQKRALAVAIDGFFKPPYDNLAGDELHELKNNLVNYVEYYRPGLAEEQGFEYIHEKYDFKWQTAQEPGQFWRTDELHSMLATWARELPDTLEEHYARFFNDRSAMVDAVWEAHYDRHNELLEEEDTVYEYEEAEEDSYDPPDDNS